MASYSPTADPRLGGHRWSGPRLAHQAASVKDESANHGAQAILALLVDAMKLADLQVQLLTLDVRETWAGAWKTALLLAAAATALLAALPVAMFGIAEWLHESAGLSLQFALLLVAGIVLIAAGGLLVWSAKRLAVAIQPMRRSADELRANLTWMRSVLHDESVETPPVL